MDSEEESDIVKTTNDFNVLDSQNLNQEDLDALKGDAIGNTVYSEKWILETLISLSKIYEEEALTDSLEGNLCILWDMTAEKDIVLFLRDNNFLQIAEFTIKISENLRLTEIIVGIIGNMCCEPTILETVGNSENAASQIFRLLSNDDAPTLIQVLRLLQSSVWAIQKDSKSPWLRHFAECEYFSDAISFILQSSTNDDLLNAAIDLLQLMTRVEMENKNSLLIDIMDIQQFLPALLESFEQFMPKYNLSYSNADMKFIDNWLTILSNIIESKYQVFINNKTNAIGPTIVNILSKILKPYANPGCLVPVDGKLDSCIRNCVGITSWFQNNQISMDSNFISIIVAYVHQLNIANEPETEMDEFEEAQDTKELEEYLKTYILETLAAIDVNKLMEIVELSSKEVTNFLTTFIQQHANELPAEIAKFSAH